MRRIPWRDRILLCEAMVWLAMASIVIAATPFRFVARTGAWGGRRAFSSRGEQLAISRRVRWAVTACGSLIPWRVVCFQRGLAAHWMLRRRGVPSVLYYGAANNAASRLTAHVWVCDGDYDVAGAASSARFGVLVTFPPRPDVRHAPVADTSDLTQSTVDRETYIIPSSADGP